MGKMRLSVRLEETLSTSQSLGALLRAEGLLTQAQLDAAISDQEGSAKPLGRILIDRGLITEVELVRTLARQLGMEFVDLDGVEIDASAANTIPEMLARRYQALPIGWEGEFLVLAVADPANVFAVDDIRAIAGVELKTVVATSSQVLDAISRTYRAGGESPTAGLVDESELVPDAEVADAAHAADRDGENGSSLDVARAIFDQISDFDAPAEPERGDSVEPTTAETADATADATVDVTAEADAVVAGSEVVEPAPEPPKSRRRSKKAAIEPEALADLDVIAQAASEAAAVLESPPEEVKAPESAREGRGVGDGVNAEIDRQRERAAKIGMPFVDLTEWQIDASVVSLIPEAVARRYQVLPIGWDDDRLVIAMFDPTNVFAIDDIRAITKREVKTVVVAGSQLGDAIDRVHRLDSEVDTVAQAAATEFDTPDDIASLREVVEDAPIVKFVNLLIAQAVSDRASDIHVEPTERDLRIRFRIDGVLHEVMHSPKSIQAGVISRLKIMAEIDIAERRIPQDGRISLSIGGKPVDLRVATLPTVYGEKIVMRILDKSTALLRLDDLGFLPEAGKRFEQSYRKPYGTILVTGPTGSGKSTTLYATLNILNEPDRNVITVEDPVEYRLAGINQVQINPKAGLSFAAALRSILRSDPDIVLVGEIRDRETAVIAVEAALTGHLVLSTLHTNDAASTPMRLVEMGVEPFLVTSALDCVVAQRLARRLCERCREPFQPTEADLLAASWHVEDLDELPTLYRAAGCATCGRTGYKGRFGIHEVMTLSEEIERAIIERRSTEDIKKIATMQGMVPMRDDGLRKVAAGLTSLEEIFRVVA